MGVYVFLSLLNKRTQFQKLSYQKMIGIGRLEGVMCPISDRRILKSLPARLLYILSIFFELKCENNEEK